MATLSYPRISISPIESIRYPRIQPEFGWNFGLNDDETDLLNEAVQIHSAREVFYRSQPPRMTEHFRRAVHLRYADPDHPIEDLIGDIPGVPSRYAGIVGSFP